MSPTVYISIGSNIEHEKNINAGLIALAEHVGILCVSFVYENPAVGFSAPPFYNLAVALDCPLPANDFISLLNTIEIANGRSPTKTNKFTSRTLDLDLIAYGSAIYPDEDTLSNAYVLAPLSEVAGESVHPTLHKTYRHLWESFQGDRTTLTRLTDYSWPSIPLKHASL